MALKNNSLNKKDKSILSEKQLKKIDKKIEEIEDIYFGELALSRRNEPTFTSKQVREQLGL